MLRNCRIGGRPIGTLSHAPGLLFGVIATLLFGSALSADTSLQNVTVMLRPQNLFASECLMTSDDGFPTTVYGTAPTEGNQFVFHDPVPQGAIVVSLGSRFHRWRHASPHPASPSN